jgi:DNA repair protein RecN (Recombination protein N)
MLRALSIRDFVIVDRVELETGGGFTVLTGETGAGKSILVDAIDCWWRARRRVAGARRGGARRTVGRIRFSRQCIVERLLASRARRRSGARHPAPHDRRAGRSRCFINGHAATLAQLREAGEHLVDIHGQHEHQSLLRARAQRDLLDAHAGAQELAHDCAEAWRSWKRLAALAPRPSSSSPGAKPSARSCRKGADLKKLGLKEGEWDELAAQHQRLAHGSSLLAGAQSSLEALSEADGACLPQLSAVASRLRALSEHDAS